MPVIFVGQVPGIQVGQELQITGSWQKHPRFGRQVLTHHCEVILPSNRTGMEAYLAGGFVKGIGPVLAKRLIHHFGDALFAIMDTEMHRLLEVQGIGKHTLNRIERNWNQGRKMRDLATALQPYHIPRHLIFKIYRAYGSRALEILRNNPYLLAIEIHGIGFHTADRIAQSLGIAKNDPFRLQAALLFALDEALQEGHMYLPRQVLSRKALNLLESGIQAIEIDAALTAALAKKGSRIIAVVLADQDSAIYLKQSLECERKVSAELVRLFAAPLPRFHASHDLETEIARIGETQKTVFSNSQKQAILVALTNKVSIVTGGPGTGKTTIIKTLLAVFRRGRVSVALAAPTGRAAGRMEESTGEAAKTIHRLLNFQPKSGQFMHDGQNPLPIDTVVIDEASMLDIFLSKAVLEAIPSHARCIFVGDVHQLPPVGPGNFLRDLIESKIVPVTTLTEIFRQSKKSLIVMNAHAIRDGQLPSYPKDKNALSDFYFIEAEQSERILTLLHRLMTERIPKRFGIPSRDIQVLTPMNRGPLGTQALNAQLQQWLNPLAEKGSAGFFPGDRVMQLRNNYDLEVFNGDIGIVKTSDPRSGELKVDYEGRTVLYRETQTDELGLAYACTVHKSQGSEYAAVIVPIVSEHFIMLNRNLIYTALTRAKKLAVFIGTPKALRLAIERHETHKRFSGLKEALQERIGEKIPLFLR